MSLSIPNIIWSKGLGAFANPKMKKYWNDHTLMVRSTNYFWDNRTNFGPLTWIRLGSGKNCDLVNFSKIVDFLPHPITLITTDGDNLVPTSLPREVVSKILSSDNIYRWYTQNLLSPSHPKLHSLPVGLDLHSFNGQPIDNIAGNGEISALTKLDKLKEVLQQAPTSSQRNLNVLCHVTTGQFNYQTFSPDSLQTLRECSGLEIVNLPSDQVKTWETYSKYCFVISGDGPRDCHRTWELLLLGCIVITKSSSLDTLYQDLPVVIVKDWSEIRESNLEKWRQTYLPLTQSKAIFEKLSLKNCLGQISPPPNHQRPQVQRYHPRVDGLTISCPQYPDRFVFDTYYLGPTDFILKVYKLDDKPASYLEITIQETGHLDKMVNYVIRDFQEGREDQEDQEQVQDIYVNHKFRTSPKPFEMTPHQKIPKIIYQTFKHSNIPQLSQRFRKCLCEINPEYQYQFFDDVACRDFIRNHCPPDVLDAFDTLQPGAFKADLWRYCVLYQTGGLYLDLSVKPLKSFRSWLKPEHEFLSVIDIPKVQGFVWNGFMACRPKHPFLKQAIDGIIHNVKTKYYSEPVLWTTSDKLRSYQQNLEAEIQLENLACLAITGPLLLAKSINQVIGLDPKSQFRYGDNLDEKSGQFPFNMLRLTDTHISYHHQHVLDYRKCDIIKDMYGKGTDNYSAAVNQKTVYHQFPKEIGNLMAEKQELSLIYQTILTKYPQYQELQKPSILNFNQKRMIGVHAVTKADPTQADLFIINLDKLETSHQVSLGNIKLTSHSQTRLFIYNGEVYALINDTQDVWLVNIYTHLSQKLSFPDNLTINPSNISPLAVKDKLYFICGLQPILALECQFKTGICQIFQGGHQDFQHPNRDIFTLSTPFIRIGGRKSTIYLGFIFQGTEVDEKTKKLMSMYGPTDVKHVSHAVTLNFSQGQFRLRYFSGPMTYKGMLNERHHGLTLVGNEYYLSLSINNRCGLVCRGKPIGLLN